jgi:NADH-quinone oxidoreductase subunit M
VNRWWAAVGVLGLILGAAYLLWLYQRTMLGPLRSDENRTLRDLSFRERVVVVPLVVLVFAIGLYPSPIFSLLERPVSVVLERVHGQKQVQIPLSPGAVR